MLTLCLWLLLCLASNSALAVDHDWSLESDTTLSREGYFVLTWSLGDRPVYEVQQSDNPAFIGATSYQVPAGSSMTLSGLADGNYYFRAGLEDNWTETVRVTVEHHSLARALGIFSSGFILFVILVFVILRGNKRHNVERHSAKRQTHE